MYTPHTSESQKDDRVVMARIATIVARFYEEMAVPQAQTRSLRKTETGRTKISQLLERCILTTT